MSGLITLATIGGLMYGGTPLLILFSQKMQARPAFVPIDPSNTPPEFARFFSQIVPLLEAEGFRVSASLGMPSQMPNQKTYLVMLVNRSSGDKAMVTVIHSTAENATTTTSYVEFSTRFDSGECFDTLNAKTLSSFQEEPHETKTRVPSVQDVRTLYQIHRWAMSQKTPRGGKIVYKDDEAISYLTKVMIESYDSQVKYGRLSLDSNAGVYRPTIKGAYLMTWGQLPPVNWIRNAMMQSREAAILKAFRAQNGVGGATAAPDNRTPWS